MTTHYIIMSSSYSKGQRIALDYFLEEKSLDKLREAVSIITEKCGKDVSISTHFIQTDSESWRSVIEKDHFFKDFYVCKSMKEFISLIKQDRQLKGLDIAKYILCETKCTHLKLEKLVYLCYADYLCKYLTASKLVDITHKIFTPWDKSSINNVIKNEIIKKYHCNEDL